MARRVFFSFDYDEDIWRVNQVRNSWYMMDAVGRTGKAFHDASLWEKKKLESDEAIRRAINEGLEGTSMTVVLTGSMTRKSDWVKYEIQRSVEKKPANGLLEINIHQLKRPFERPAKPPSIFAPTTIQIALNESSKMLFLNYVPATYDWVLNKGFDNFVLWVEEAARAVGR